jgi:xanthine/uracil/vitamin C permease (AzgA family)
MGIASLLSRALMRAPPDIAPLICSIGNGLAFGIAASRLLKLLRGRITRIGRPLLVLSALYEARFAWPSGG